MKVFIFLFSALLWLVTGPAHAEKPPALPETLEFMTATRVSDAFRYRLWCEIYRDTSGVVELLWFVCRLHPDRPVGLITITESYGTTYIVWAAAGFGLE